MFTTIVFVACMRSSLSLAATVFWLMCTLGRNDRDGEVDQHKLIGAFSFLIAGEFVPSKPILHTLGGV